MRFGVVRQTMARRARDRPKGNWQWAVGNGQWAVGSGQWAMGNGQWAVGSGQWAVGNGQWAIGNWQRNMHQRTGVGYSGGRLAKARLIRGWCPGRKRWRHGLAPATLMRRFPRSGTNRRDRRPHNPERNGRNFWGASWRNDTRSTGSGRSHVTGPGHARVVRCPVHRRRMTETFVASPPGNDRYIDQPRARKSTGGGCECATRWAGGRSVGQYRVQPAGGLRAQPGRRGVRPLQPRLR